MGSNVNIAARASRLTPARAKWSGTERRFNTSISKSSGYSCMSGPRSALKSSPGAVTFGAASVEGVGERVVMRVCARDV